MARYRMSDGTVVDTEKSSYSWKEGDRHDGRNLISLATGQQFEHEGLYRSRKGRYYIESWSNWQGSIPRAEWVSNEEATRWLIQNEYDPEGDEFPKELTSLVDEVSE